MILTRTLLTLACSFLVIQGGSHSKEWKKIIPLHSNRADVERLLGPATAVCKCVYELEDVTIQVSYSDGSCQSGGSSGWNVLPGTVLRFNVHPKMSLQLADLTLDLKLDLKRFTRNEDSELPGIVHYSEKAKGVVISADQERVLDYGFEPPEKDATLHCP